MTRVFDDMLRRSIPQYEVMRKAVYDLACAHARPRTEIVDLGCARGEQLAGLIDKFGAYNRYVGVDVAEPMLAVCRERFKGYIANNIVRIANMDLRREFPPVRASVVLSILTIQFVPIEHRQRIVQDVFDRLEPGGAFLFVEKVLGADSPINTLMVDAYHKLKVANGYAPDDVERKRLALEGVLVPVTAYWNEDLLKQAGFRRFDCFWRWMNFAGWIAVKG